MADGAQSAAEDVEVMFLPKDVLDLPTMVCTPGGPPNGMTYLGPFLPSPKAVKANDAVWLTLRLLSQYPGWVAPSKPVTTSSLIVAQPVVIDANAAATPSPVKVDDPNSHLGEAMTDWIDRPPPGGAAVIGSWTFEQTSGVLNFPDVTFSFDFALENDPRILTVAAVRGQDYDTFISMGDGSAKRAHTTGQRSYTVTLTNGSTSVSVSASDGPSPSARSFTTTEPAGALRNLIVNVRWIEDNLFVVLTPADFGDPAVPAPSPFGPFGEGGGGGPFGA